MNDEFQNDDFDGTLDDLEFENYKTSREKVAQFEQRIRAEEGRKAEARVQQEAFIEASKELGLEGPELQALISNLDGDTASGLYKDAAKNYLKRAASLARGPRPQRPDGRFMSKAEIEAMGGRKPAEQPEKPDLNDLREKSRTRGLSDSDEMDVISRIFPDPL